MDALQMYPLLLWVAERACHHTHHKTASSRPAHVDKQLTTSASCRCTLAMSAVVLQKRNEAWVASVGTEGEVKLFHSNGWSITPAAFYKTVFVALPSSALMV
jgi:hypothetical protein